LRDNQVAMTASPNAPPQVFEDVDSAVRALRDSGLRLSTARRLVLEALFSAEGPISAARLARMLSLEESSVYRNLELLEYRGVIRHIHLGHSPGLYVLASDHEVEYLYCETCAKVTAVTPDRLDTVRDHIQRELGYTLRFTHFALVGTCEDCAATQTPASAEHEHLHSHSDYVHSHPHTHSGAGRHTH
jgi:Fur family transcriptional regulator, ferric uptake regulator